MPVWAREQDEDLLQRGGGFALGQWAIAGRPRDVVDVLEQLGGEFFGRGHVIRQPGVDGAAGHAVVLGRGRVLHHGHPEVLLDGLQAQRAVAAHAGKNNADGLLPLVGRQLPEEEVDRHPQSPRGGRFEHLKFAVQDGQVRIGRNHVDVVGPHLHPILDLDDLHRRVAAKEFRHHALVGRLQVRHQHERQSAVRRQVRKELLEGLQSARRSAHSDHEGRQGSRIRSEIPTRPRGSQIVGQFPRKGCLPALLHRRSPCEPPWGSHYSATGSGPVVAPTTRAPHEV